METKLPPNVSADRDRHGNLRFYFRRDGKRVRLRETPGTEAFAREVAAARLGAAYKPGSKAPAKPAPLKSGDETSLDWLIDQYEKRGASLVSRDLADRRLRMLREIGDSKKKDRRRGTFNFRHLERRHVLEIRDELRETPGARNNIVKTISAVYAWAVETGLIEKNPAHGIRRLRSGDGFHTWTIEEIETFIARHPRGTMAHRALVVFLFSGLRLADGAILGRQHLYMRRATNGAPERWLRITPAKTRKSTGVAVDIPVLPELGREIDAAGNAMTFIVNENGAPFTVNGLGNRMRKWCDEAELPHCSAHGLRKAGATIAAENGADYELLKAIYGWTTAQQANHYVQKARRTKIAASAGRYLFLEQSMD